MGNSVGVIIPNEFLKESGAPVGDKVRFALAIPNHQQSRALERIAGIDHEASGFTREKRDR